ncbi:MAG: hypothetical protein LQ342_006266 [Letrouitia transgressa]|nr:MAG: hypothetical protein LQ342_006266 [Letrouitia transgressa]
MGIPLENKSTEATRNALEFAHREYSRLNPASHQAFLSSCKHLPGGNTRTVLHAHPFPITFASGNGCTLTSLDGSTYIDFLGEYTAGIYGHNNAIIRDAIDEALAKGWSFGGHSLYEKELAKLVCERFRPTMELVRFTNSGTEANMMAVATAMAWTGRKSVLVFQGGYHGATLSFRAQTAESMRQKSLNIPHQWVVGVYNDITKTKDVLSTLPDNRLAAILVEPMLGSAGAIPGSLSFLNFLRKYASDHGALLIFDEVMTSRLSYRGLGYKMGIQPDLMTLGKWVGGGMSFGAFGGRADIMALFDPTQSHGLMHAGTFNNNIISMAAGCAGCNIMDEQTIDRLNGLGDLLKAKSQDAIDNILGVSAAQNSSMQHINGHTKLEDATADSEPATPMYVSGIGSILAVHFRSSGLQSLFYHHMLSQGIYIAERGFMALNIELGVAEVEKFVEVTKIFLTRYQQLILEGRKEEGE